MYSDKDVKYQLCKEDVVPCRDCEMREVGCRTSCSKWQKWKLVHEVNLQRKELNERTRLDFIAIKTDAINHSKSRNRGKKRGIKCKGHQEEGRSYKRKSNQ